MIDALHLSPAPTEELYYTKIRPVVRAAMNGFNGTVFAYGTFWLQKRYRD